MNIDIIREIQKDVKNTAVVGIKGVAECKFLILKLPFSKEAKELLKSYRE